MILPFGEAVAPYVPVDCPSESPLIEFNGATSSSVDGFFPSVDDVVEPSDFDVPPIDILPQADEGIEVLPQAEGNTRADEEKTGPGDETVGSQTNDETVSSDSADGDESVTDETSGNNSTGGSLLDSSAIDFATFV